MRLLFLNRSYYPDVEATGQLLTELCSDLAAMHDVRVIAGQPNFVQTATRWAFVSVERHLGVEILRVRNIRFTKASLVGRALGLISYLLIAFWAGLTSSRPQTIIVETDPPFLGLLGAILKWWHRCPFIYYLQDLYPEVGLAMGKLRPGTLTALLRWATQVGLRRADQIIVLGEDMRRKVLDRGILPARITIIPNWADTAHVRPQREGNRLRAQWEAAGRFVVAYSGNIGLSQNLEQVLVAARQLQGDPVAFLLIGEGAHKASLQARARDWGLTNVTFLPYQPKERLGESLSAADVHLVPLQKGLAGTIVPSKLYGILAAGVAYIAAVEPDSEVAYVTERHRTGLLIPPDSPEELAKAIRWSLAHREELLMMGRRGRVLAESEFDRRHSVARFQRVLETVSGRSSRLKLVSSGENHTSMHSLEVTTLAQPVT